ncbi:MAG: hypothetical protein WCO35_03935 [Candidatus Nomurabacteria bacterium]
MKTKFLSLFIFTLIIFSCNKNKKEEKLSLIKVKCTLIEKNISIFALVDTIKNPIKIGEIKFLGTDITNDWIIQNEYSKFTAKIDSILH